MNQVPGAVDASADLPWGRRSLWYDRDGIPITHQQFQPLWYDMAYRRVGLTTITDPNHPEMSFRVSTAWMGMDSGLGYGPPLIFETMVFRGDGTECQERSCTLAQAQLTHARMVAEHAASVPGAVVADIEDDPQVQADLDKIKAALNSYAPPHP